MKLIQFKEIKEGFGFDKLKLLFELKNNSRLIEGSMQRVVKVTSQTENLNNDSGQGRLALVNKDLRWFIQISKLYSRVYVGIVNDPVTKGKRYVVVEPTFDDRDKRNFDIIKRILMSELTEDLLNATSKEENEKLLKKTITAIIKKYKLAVPKGSLQKIIYYAVRDFINLGKIEPLMHDHMIEEISCDGIGVPLYIWHREYESIPTNVIFNTEKELDDFILKLAYISGKYVSIANPIVDASLPDGSRINLTFGHEISKKGSTFTIRKFSSDPITITDLIKFNTISSEIAAFLWYFVEKRLTMLVAGGTASGKTSMLNALAAFISSGSKVVSIEDTAELNIPHENWIQMVSRQNFTTGAINEITQFDLLRAALRQRPDIIIVGETRGKEAYTLFQAMATGHGGFSTIHADSIDATITRLTSDPMNVPKTLIANSLDAILLQIKLKIGDRSIRRVLQISEVVNINANTGEITLGDVCRWDPNTDTHFFIGGSMMFEKITKRYGVSIEQISQEISKRRVVLDWMVRNNIRKYKEITYTLGEFYREQEKFLKSKKLENLV